MTYKSDRVRTAALVAHYASKHSGVNPVVHLRNLLDDDEYADIRAPTQFIRDVVTKWQHHGAVANLFSTRVSSHPKKVPDEVIRKCATIIKAGYNVQLLVTSGSGQATQHQFLAGHYLGASAQARRHRPGGGDIPVPAQVFGQCPSHQGSGVLVHDLHSSLPLSVTDGSS